MPERRQTRYPRYEREVNALLDFARQARRVEDMFPDEVSSTDIIGNLTLAAETWVWDLIEIILDQEERLTEFRTKWKCWRKRRKVALPPPNATYIGSIAPTPRKRPSSKRRRR